MGPFICEKPVLVAIRSLMLKNSITQLVANSELETAIELQAVQQPIGVFIYGTSRLLSVTIISS